MRKLPLVVASLLLLSTATAARLKEQTRNEFETYVAAAEASMDKYSFLARPKYHIRSSWNVFASEPVSITHPVDQTANLHLGFSVLASYARHPFTALTWCKWVISHGIPFFQLNILAVGPLFSRLPGDFTSIVADKFWSALLRNNIIPTIRLKRYERRPDVLVG